MLDIFKKKYCAGCRKVKWNVKRRSYIVSKVSPRPITSVDAICNDCFKSVKSKVN